MYSESKSCQLVLKSWIDNPQIHMEFQGGSQIYNIVLKKMNKARVLTNFKTPYKATIIKTVSVGQFSQFIHSVMSDSL